MTTKYAGQTRNLNAPPEAHVARIIWGKEYSAQRGGVMDFWDILSDDQRSRCRMVVKELRQRMMSGNTRGKSHDR